MTKPLATEPVSAPEWKNSVERSNASAMRLMAWLSLRLGRRLTRPVVFAIAAYYLIAGAAARRASRQYLTRVLASKPGWQQVFAHVLCFATVIHDRIYFLTGRFSLFEIQLHGNREFAQDWERGVPLLLMGGHLGSFEAMRAVAEKTGIQVSMLMYEDNATMINATLAALKPDPAPRIISLQRIDAMLKAQADLAAGRVLGMLADRRLGSEPVDRCAFLGAEAAFPRNPHRLAAILGCKVYFMAAPHLGGNRYAIHLLPLADFSPAGSHDASRGTRPARIAAAQGAYAAALETVTRGAPLNWFNFFDFWADADGGSTR